MLQQEATESHCTDRYNHHPPIAFLTIEIFLCCYQWLIQYEAVLAFTYFFMILLSNSKPRLAGPGPWSQKHSQDQYTWINTYRCGSNEASDFSKKFWFRQRTAILYLKPTYNWSIRLVLNVSVSSSEISFPCHSGSSSMLSDKAPSSSRSS